VSFHRDQTSKTDYLYLHKNITSFGCYKSDHPALAQSVSFLSFTLISREARRIRVRKREGGLSSFVALRIALLLFMETISKVKLIDQ